LEFPIGLNKFEKRDLVIQLHKKGKTYSEIAHIAHVSLRDIKPILKNYERKLETKRGEKKIRTKKPSISSQTFILFKEGKKLDEVKVLLDVPFKIALRYWKQYLKSIRMYECFEFYEVWQYDLPSLLSISTFMKRNNVSGINILNVLRTTNDILNLREEIERLKQMKNNQNTNYQPLPPLGLPEHYYHY
jgi:hypothetical protein